MRILRTPDDRFTNLPGWPYAPHYTTITDADGTDIRIAHAETGPADAPVILLMHGNPTWSYLYRNMIAPLASNTGHRVIAVDLVGCGRSDKPAEKSDYTLARHYDWMSQWLRAMNLNDITLFCQDWGGTIGLYLVSQFPDRFARVVAANTGLPIGGGASDFMNMWVGMMRAATEFPWPMLASGMQAELSPAELAAYRAPFPTPHYESGLCEFPALIAVQPDNPGTPLNKAAWARLATFGKPFLTLFGALDPVSKGADLALQSHIPGARNQPHKRIANANHFIQEDVPALLVSEITDFIAATTPRT